MQWFGGRNSRSRDITWEAWWSQRNPRIPCDLQMFITRKQNSESRLRDPGSRILTSAAILNSLQRWWRHGRWHCKTVMTFERRKWEVMSILVTAAKRYGQLMLVMLIRAKLWEKKICGKPSGSDVATVVKWRRNGAVDTINRDRIPLQPDPLCASTKKWLTGVRAWLVTVGPRRSYKTSDHGRTPELADLLVRRLLVGSSYASLSRRNGEDANRAAKWNWCSMEKSSPIFG